jgi:hypothetical protein
MSVEEFFEYAAYNQIEPFGDDREDMRAAIIPHMLGDFFSKKGKGPRYEEYLLSNMLANRGEKPRRKVQRQTQAQMEAVLKGLYLKSKKS